jgi:glycosyltransferase involved in cell wall biosynthesis
MRPSSVLTSARPAGAAAADVDVDVVIPVYNEQRVLAASVGRLHRFLGAELLCSWRIVIADNASIDETPAIARMLAAELPGVELLRKAVRADVLPELLGDVRDEEWFFDTELLVLAERQGLRIHEVPVDWVDDPDSRVAIVSTALADLRGVARLALTRPRHVPPRPSEVRRVRSAPRPGL